MVHFVTGLPLYAIKNLSTLKTFLSSCFLSVVYSKIKFDENLLSKLANVGLYV